MSQLQRSMFTSDATHSAQINSHLGRRRQPRGGRTRRLWSDREDETLVLALKEIVVRGWKADNGFRSGYLGLLEDALRKKFPNTDIKGQPHIVSKIAAWKKSYSSLGRILGRSGIGFNNHGDYKIECNDDQWDQIVKSDPNARFMRPKSWPYWEHWQIIFGKDCAHGGHTKHILDAVDDLYREEHVNESGNGFGDSVNLEEMHASAEATEATDTNMNEDPAESSRNTTRVGGSTSNTGKKRRTEVGADGLIELLGRMHNDTNARLDNLSLRVGYEFDLSKARKEVYELLGHLPGLSRDQKFDAGEIILEKVQRLDFFHGMPDEDRLAYVFRMLAKYG